MGSRCIKNERIGGMSVLNNKIGNSWKLMCCRGLIIIALVASLSGCGREEENSDEIEIEQSSEEYIGENYEDVVSEMKDLGFINIETQAIEDLILGWFTEEYSVEEITIGGTTDFENGDIFTIEDEVIISYHAFPEEDDKEEGNVDSEEAKSEITSDDEELTESEDEVEHEEESIYEKAYKVSFSEYEIYYLIDEDEQTVTRFAAYVDDEMTEGIKVYSYEGNFNDGIEFGTEEVVQRAHYKYTDIDTTLIVWSGSISNEASRTDADSADEYMKKLLDEGRLVSID